MDSSTCSGNGPLSASSSARSSLRSSGARRCCSCRRSSWIRAWRCCSANRAFCDGAARRRSTVRRIAGRQPALLIAAARDLERNSDRRRACGLRTGSATIAIASGRHRDERTLSGVAPVDRGQKRNDFLSAQVNQRDDAHRRIAAGVAIELFDERLQALQGAPIPRSHQQSLLIFERDDGRRFRLRPIKLAQLLRYSLRRTLPERDDCNTLVADISIGNAHKLGDSFNLIRRRFDDGLFFVAWVEIARPRDQ